MKISKKTLLVMSGMLSMSALWLMFVSATDDKNLFMDVNNAIQHIPEIKIVSTGNSNNTTATIKKVGDNLVWIDTDNFILWQAWDNKNTISKNSKYSSILWWIKNKIQWNYNVIIWGSWNNINEQQYNTIVWWENNTIVWWENNTIDSNNKWYNTIAWWKNNKIEVSSLASVIVWGHDNTIHQGKYSVVMWNNSSVKWTNSVALWSWAKINASNSFLWTDGENNETLKEDDVFAIMAKNWAVINSDKAHTFAKLTLWWPLIISSSESQTGIVCKWWQWWWIIKIEKSDNNQLCLCSCDGSGWNSMFYKGRCLSVCNQSLEPPKCGSTVDRECTSKWIIYSWSCENWLIIEWTGAYFVDKNNKVHRSCQTYDGQVASCSGNVNTNENISDCIICPEGSVYDKTLKTCVCDGDQVYDKENNKCYCPTWKEWSEKRKRCMDKQKQANCPALTDTNWHWENPQFTQTWNEEFNMYTPIPGLLTQPTCDSNSSAPCSKYACNDHYSCNNGTCKADTQTWKCQWNPENSHWVVSQFTQTWSGGLNKRYPETKIWTYTSDTNSKVECSYTCDDNYTRDGNKCNPDTQTWTCQWKPSNAIWLNENFTQTWSGSLNNRYPSTKTWTYTSDTNSKVECSYTCNTANWYTWDSANNKCIGNTRTWECQWLPNNAHWINSWFTQTFDGNNWTPSNIELTNTWNSSVECSYTCNNGYSKDGNGCTQTPKCDIPNKNCEIWDKENLENNWTIERWRCVKWSVSRTCWCQSDLNKVCPYEDYERDSSIGACKFIPKFCMMQKGYYYDTDERFDVCSTVFNNSHECFDINYPSFCSASHQGYPMTNNWNIVSSTDPAAKNYFNLDNLGITWFILPSYYYYYQNRLNWDENYIRIRNFMYIKDFLNYDSVTKVYWENKETIESAVEDLINKWKCTIDNLDSGDWWFSLDCDLKDWWHPLFTKDKSWSYLWCPQQS